MAEAEQERSTDYPDERKAVKDVLENYLEDNLLIEQVVESIFKDMDLTLGKKKASSDGKATRRLMQEYTREAERFQEAVVSIRKACQNSLNDGLSVVGSTLRKELNKQGSSIEEVGKVLAAFDATAQLDDQHTRDWIEDTKDASNDMTGKMSVARDIADLVRSALNENQQKTAKLICEIFEALGSPMTSVDSVRGTVRSHWIKKHA
ncbi:MAG: hypothetical protein HKN50_02585 [Gammaproteobacteria bacterium]|nr:hypothetical protein [Gammaproteobacteria bacterium]